MSDIEKWIHVPKAAGYSIPSHAQVLDLGCGNGSAVQELRDIGYDAVGCDLKFKTGSLPRTAPTHGVDPPDRFSALPTPLFMTRRSMASSVSKSSSMSKTSMTRLQRFGACCG